MLKIISRCYCKSFIMQTLGLLTGAPCNGKEGRTTNCYECFWVNFDVKGAEPWKFVWGRTGKLVRRLPGFH